MSLLEKLIVGVVLLFLGAGAIWSGIGRIEDRGYQRRVAEEEAEAVRIGGQRQAVTANVDTKHAKAAERIKVVTVTQIKEIPTYVSANDCPMSPGFRVLHDAAAAGELPDAASIADAAAVPAPALADTIVTNYGACTETSQRLTDLQEWLRQQQKVR